MPKQSARRKSKDRTRTAEASSMKAGRPRGTKMAAKRRNAGGTSRRGRGGATRNKRSTTR